MTDNSINNGPENTVRGNTKNTREDWLMEAQRVLINEGVDRVKVDRLAKNLKVTRGGFYWFFKNRQDLLNALLDDWTDNESDPLTRAIKNETNGPLNILSRYFLILIREQSYSPFLDSAVRDWARTSSRARSAVELVDSRRIQALTEIFLNLNYEQENAFIRARILYFHQVGYYAMEVRETKEQRLNYFPTYFKQLTGFDLPEQK